MTLPTVTFVNNEMIYIIAVDATSLPAGVQLEDQTAKTFTELATASYTPYGYVGYQGSTQDLTKDEIDTLMTDGFCVYYEATSS